MTTAPQPANLVRVIEGFAVDDELPRKKTTHEVGGDLSLLSVGELEGRVALLREEIARIEAAMTKKRASLAGADLFFRK